MSRPCFGFLDMVQFLFTHHPEFGTSGERFDYVTVSSDLSGFSFHYYKEDYPFGIQTGTMRRTANNISDHSIMVRWEDAQDLFGMYRALGMVNEAEVFGASENVKFSTDKYFPVGSAAIFNGWVYKKVNETPAGEWIDGDWELIPAGTPVPF